MRLLILGGTADGRKLAESLHNKGVSVTYSVAGLVRMPNVECHVVSGGFSRFGGLSAFIKQNNISAILDVTHPYAYTMSTKAAGAAQVCNIPCWRFHRPQWCAEQGDCWQFFEDWQGVCKVITGFHSVFLTCGQLSQQQVDDLDRNKEQRILLRTAVEPKHNLPNAMHWIKAIGPFSLNDELSLMKKYNIDVLVSKNSGGDSTIAKLFAARELGIPVLMLERPLLPEVDLQFNTYEECLTHIVSVFSL